MNFHDISILALSLDLFQYNWYDFFIEVVNATGLLEGDLMIEIDERDIVEGSVSTEEGAGIRAVRRFNANWQPLFKTPLNGVKVLVAFFERPYSTMYAYHLRDKGYESLVAAGREGTKSEPLATIMAKAFRPHVILTDLFDLTWGDLTPSTPPHEADEDGDISSCHKWARQIVGDCPEIRKVVFLSDAFDEGRRLEYFREKCPSWEKTGFAYLGSDTTVEKIHTLIQKSVASV